MRQIKRTARRQLHERMADPVLYLTSKTATPEPLTVRLHISFAELGELLRGGFADRNELTPRAVFMDYVPARGGIIITEDMGAWIIDNTMPPEDITVTAEILKMTPTQITAAGWNPSAPWLGFSV